MDSLSVWVAVFFTIISRLCVAQDPPQPFPPIDSYLSTTNILNHSSYVDSFDEPQWYLDNIPFVDFPDTAIQDVYYYRATVIKRHLKFAHEGHGWSFTEFIHPVAWGIGNITFFTGLWLIHTSKQASNYSRFCAPSHGRNSVASQS